MKRLEQISKGVYRYSTGQIGTSDLPQFVAELAYFRQGSSKRQEHMMRCIRPVKDTRDKYQSQLLRAYAHLKQAAKKH